jgi:murein DD-endopeptidase MepM/ murein hydrolase activator NlpD
MPDNGFFQLNSEILSIPPEQIAIQHKNYNNIWQTLRTRSSAKVKSGFSQIEITVRVQFINNVLFPVTGSLAINDFGKLRNLISQFKVTPFCYVENQYIRNNILNGNPAKNMALALRQLELLTSQEQTGIITAIFHFAWFNYFPFAKNFSFKKDIFSADEVLNPIDSNAWKLMYEAEQKRTNYSPIVSLDSQTIFRYPEYRMLNQKQFTQLKNDYKLYQQLQKDNLNQQVPATREKAIELGFQSSEVLGLFGNQTSQEENVKLEDFINTLSQLSKNPTTVFSTFRDNNWTYVKLKKDEKPIILKTHLLSKRQETEQELNKFEPEDLMIIQRTHEIDSDKIGLVITGIHISFENILATIPMIGYSWPTYQHIGSSDFVISISFQTFTEEAERNLSHLINTFNEQSIKNRQIPQGHRNIQIRNSLIEMCGLKNFVIENKSIQTIPGQPGLSSGVLVFLDDSLNEKTEERIAKGQSFGSSADLRNMVAEILTNNLEIKPDAIVFEDGKGRLSDLPEATTRVKGNLVQSVSRSNYYNYTGPDDNNHTQFKQLCLQYSAQLSQVLIKIVPFLQDNADSFLAYVNALFRTPVIAGNELLFDFFGISDNEITGISKLQKDVFPVYQKNPLLNRWGGKAINSLGKLQNVSRNEIIQRQQRLENQQVPFSILSTESANVRQSQGNIENLKDSTALFVDSYLGDWQNFVNPFLDKILYSGLIALPEFKKVRDFITQQTEISSGDCYPDFPLAQVVDKLSNSKSALDKDASDRLNKLADEQKLGLKNLGLSILINPDFYFFNPLKDNLDVDELVPADIRQRAVDGIIATRAKQVGVEKDYYRGVVKEVKEAKDSYEVSKQIINESLQRSENKSLFATKAGQSYKQEIELAKNEEIFFMPNQLTEPVTNSINQATINGETIEIKPIQKDIKNQNTVTNLRSDTLMMSGSDKFVYHMFTTDGVLKPQPVQNRPIITTSSNDEPKFDWPTIDTRARRIGKNSAGEFDETGTDPDNPRGRPHEGVDINYIWEKDHPKGLRPEEAKKIEIRPSAPGTIIRMHSLTSGEGNSVFIKHAAGYETRYFHLQDENIFRSLKERVDKGEIIEVDRSTTIGYMGNSGAKLPSSNPDPETRGFHLHFEIRKNGKPIDPQLKLDPDSQPQDLPNPAIQSDESILSKSIEQLKTDTYQYTGYSMMRAYPTFKLYFIESDLGERKRYAFDDFFSYSAVKSIQCVKSRKIAADLLVMELTNISGVLSNRKFVDANDPTKARSDTTSSAQNFNPQDVNTSLENPIASLMLQPGVQMQLRLGYDNNPNNLEKVFNGIITDVEFSETDDLVTVVCQSFATELVQTIHGESKSYGGFFIGRGNGRTFKILEEIMAQPEVVHFGRWEGKEYGRNTQRSILKSNFKFVPSPQDDNIFAPQGDSATGFIDAFLANDTYVMYQNTLWDVIQEMTLRHPSYVACPVPYDGKMGPRMTMFFGVPDQLYFSRDSSYEEDTVINALSEAVKNGQTAETEALTRTEVRTSGTTLDENEVNRLTSKESKYRERHFELWKKRFALQKGFIKPFRNYHVASSSLNLISNSISASGHNVANVVTVQYGEDTADPNEKTGELDFDGSTTYTVKADDMIRDEEKREIFLQFPNCVGEEMAKTYCVSALFNSLKESYKGSLVLLGNPAIKCYDIVYVFDTYNDMYGPVEVEQVIHKFTQETGFVTEITPNLVVHVNQEATLSTSDAMGYMAEYAMKKMGMSPGTIETLETINNALAYNPLLPTALLGGLFFNSTENTLSTGTNNGPFSLLGLFVFKKLITKTQLAHPFRFSPLVLQTHPMIGGLPNRRTGGGFFQPLGDFIQDYKDYGMQYFEYLADKISPQSWLGKSEGKIELYNK